MKTNSILLTLALFTCTLLSAQSTKRSPLFKHLSKQRSNTAFAKAATQSLPQKTISFNWDEDNEDWVTIPDTTLTTYNPNGTVNTEIQVYIGGGPNTFKSLTTYTYNSSNNPVAYYHFSWNEIDSKWDSTGKTFYVYDSHGNQTEQSSYYLMDDIWEFSWGYKSIYTYDANNRIIGETGQEWDSDSSVYVNSSKSLYTYDGTGKISKVVFMEWNPGTAQFDSSGRIVNLVWFKWNPDLESALPLSYEMEEWNGTMYELTSRLTSSYDTHDNTLSEKEEAWDGSAWSIDYWSTYTLTYNSSDALTERISKDWDGDTLVNNRKEIYSDFFQFTGLSLVSKQLTDVHFYPNPFTETATIDIPSFNNQANTLLLVSDVLGRTVLTQAIESAHTNLEKGNLQNGLYTYQLIENNTLIHTGKFLIK